MCRRKLIMVQQLNKPRALYLKIIRQNRMRKIGLILFVFLMSSLHLHAEDQEFFIDAVEYEKIIVNWNPQGNQLARALAYECASCEVKSLVLNSETQLEDENGRTLDIQNLSRK